MKDDRVYLEHIREAVEDIKVIHDYFGVNLEIVWRVVETEVPRLKAAVDDLLAARRS